MAELVVLAGGRELSRLRLGDAELRVGRGEGNDLALDDQEVSRRHASVIPRGGGYAIEDRGSARGTFVNGERVRERALADGDDIRLGGSRVVFLARDGAEVPAGPPGREGAAADAPAPAANDARAAELGAVLASHPAGARAGRLQALFEISRLLASARDHAGLIEALLDQAVAAMGAERGLLLLADPPGSELRVRAARSRGADARSLAEEPISRGVVGRVLAEGEPVLVESALQGGTLSMVAHGIHSALAAPLKSRGAVTGVLYVDHRSRERAFTQDDLAFFAVFAVQAKAAMDSSKAYWEIVEGLFRASQDVILTCAPDGAVTRANSAAAALAGSGEEALAGQPAAELFVEEDRPAVAALLQAALERGAAGALEARIRGPRGRAAPMSLSAFALRDPGGGLLGACVVGRDLSELRSLVDRLSAANEKLRELNDMKSQFVGMVSHELKGPLAIMRGFIELVLEAEGTRMDPQNRGFLETAVRRVVQTNSLIKELLDLTRIETGKVPLNPARTDLAALVREAAEAYAAPAREAGVQVSVSGPEAAGLVGDAQMLSRLVENFVTNGIKYNRSGGRLDIAVREDPSGWAVDFADQGIGMSPKDAKRIFTRFFRADAVRDLPGTGLGLSIAKAVAERHGGSIEVRSELGKGTTFTVRLPLAPPAA